MACAVELALGKPTRRHIDYSMHRVRMLLHFGVIPYLVFDGDYLPSKSRIEVDRAKKRQESKQRGMELYRTSKPAQAYQEFQKAIDVTPEMARQLIEELKGIGVQYVVAPYEADAQLVYLERKGSIQGIISEDSDLLVFGAKRLLTKLDQYGECIEVNRADFTSCREISLFGWTDADFRCMAILSGCDYLNNINRMGLKSAYRLVRKYKTIEKIIRMLQFDGQYHVPEGYLEAFHKAEMTFLYQRVYCPTERRIVTMSEPEDGVQVEELAFIGEQLDQATAEGVARGDLDPMTKTRIVLPAHLTNASPKTPSIKTVSAINGFPSGKENKSIEQFFKSTRTPLGELDPNSFTPSPTQQQLLQRARNSSWETSPAFDETPVQHGRARGAAVNDTDQRIQSRLASYNSTSTPSSGLPRKRHHDFETLTEALRKPQEIGGTSSKFFTPVDDSTKASKKRTARGRKQPTDFTVWSDDSTEDAMIELADSVTRSDALQETKVESLVESEPSPSVVDSDCVEEVDTQSSVPSRGTIQSQASELTVATSVASSNGSLPQTIDRHVTAELSSLASKYVFQAEGKSSEREEVTSIQPEKSHQKEKPLQTSTLKRSASTSALQRLGERALNRSKSSSTLTASRSKELHPSDIQSIDESTAVLQDEKKTPQPLKVHTIDPQIPVTRGSEDALIPDSEEEEIVSDSVTEVENTPPKKSINLGRFAFAG